MFLALLLAFSAIDWVPVRWFSSDPSSLDLLQGSPINCLLLEERNWSPELVAKARGKGLTTLAVLRPGDGAVEKARGAGCDGLVLEGEFSPKPDLAGQLVIDLPYRSSIKLDSKAPVLGTYQGVWPGINIADKDVKAAPTGGPWIDTNAGFLRFLRAATDKTVWISNPPPEKGVIPAERYLMAIADAAMSGARWVLTLDADFQTRLLAREEKALAGWKKMNGLLAFVEAHKEWREFSFGGQMAVILDTASGALLCGGVLDMVVVKHTPVRPFPYAKVSAPSLAPSKMAVNVDPSALTGQQKEELKAYTRQGGTLLTGPPGWKFPPLKPGQITLGKEDTATLDTIWRELNAMTGRRNLGARLFNVSSMLSNLLVSKDGKRVLVHLVNYSNYPAESITVHVLGKWNRAVLEAPGAKPKEMAVYPVDDATGIDVDAVNSMATLIVE